MGERNNRGFFTVESLRNGQIDQHAEMRAGRKIVTELGMYPNYVPTQSRPFWVKHVVSRHGIVESSLTETFTSIDKARVRFRELVRNPRFTP